MTPTPSDAPAPCPSLPRSVLAAALATLLLTGCAAGAVSVLSDRAVMPGYSPDEFPRLAGRTIKVEVHGNPFVTPPHAFDGQIAANMNQSAAAPARFVADPSSEPITAYRVVWNFAPPHESIAPNAICQGRYVEPTGPGTPVDAYAAFCRDGEALSSVRGRLYYTDTPNSVEFLSFIDAMTTQLFPRDGSIRRRSGDARLGDRITHPF